jgi:predicted NACHT family NTPase
LFAESAQVLNSIEAHIGLLVARAMSVYSFSHLTFQEYLTAQQVVRKPSLLLKIAPHIGDQQWREVWLLLSTMLDPDDILMEIKTAADLLVANSPKIQKMLESCMNRAKRFSKDTATQRATRRA